MAAELWRDGDLKSVTLETNGFPDDLEPALPDEVFLNTGDGRVEIIRKGRAHGVDYWQVNGPDSNPYQLLFEAFEDAFKKALATVREEVEG